MLLAARRPASTTVRLPAVLLAAGLLLLLTAGGLAYLTVVEPARAIDALPAANAQPRLVRAIPYAAGINRAATRHRVNPALLAAVVAVESRFDPRAASPRGALGLAQLMPATWDELRSQVPCPETDCQLSPESNLAAGALYLGRLLDRYGQNAVLALAAYNAGARHVDRFGGTPPFPETHRYLRRVGVAWYSIQRAGTLPPWRRAVLYGFDYWSWTRDRLAAAGGVLVAGALFIRGWLWARA